MTFAKDGTHPLLPPQPKLDTFGNLCVRPPFDGLPFRRFLTNDGTGNTGIFNLIGNYSAAPTDFYYQPPDDFNIFSLRITISGSSLRRDDYGSINNGLTNGIQFWLRNLVNEEARLIHHENIKNNQDWLVVGTDSRVSNFSGNDQVLIIDFNVIDLFGMAFMIPKNYKFIVRLNDNFTGLTNHTYSLRGILQQPI
jgi:hypothetical protein